MTAMSSIKTWTARLLVACLAISLLAALLPQPAAASPVAKPRCSTSHTVKQGDTLVAIGLKYHVTPYTIADANKLLSPYTIYVGQTLCIPSSNVSGSLSAKYANAFAAYFTAGFSPDGIYVQPYYYPKNMAWVKGDNAGDKGKHFVKIGKLNSKNTANSRVYFILPAELKKAKSLTVCLKNVLTDYSQCVTFPPK